MLVLLVGVRPCAAQAVAGAGPRLLAPREFLALFEIDQQKLSVFEDGAPLDEAQRERMLAILFRLRQYSLEAVDHFATGPAAVATIAEHPAESRGQLFTLVGRVTRVVSEPLDAPLAERFDFDHYYRCTFETDARQRAVVCALAVPAAWKLDAPIDERAGAQGLFLKLLPAAAEPPDQNQPDNNQPGDRPPGAAAPPLLFVAKRVAWFSDSPLGQLGMDVGLFDTVHDRTDLDERECFYQMLAAVRRANPAALAREASQQVADTKEVLRREADDPALDAARRAAARSALEQATLGNSDIVPLFNEPATQRGSLVTLRGDALRAVEIRVDDRDVVERFGIRRYYEVEIVTDNSQNNPLVCCVAELPEGMPLGDDIRVRVRVTGFFLKSWAYHAGGEQAARQHFQLAPLVIARTLTWYPPATTTAHSMTGAAALLVALVAAAAVMWYIRRTDRRAHAAAQEARLDLPERLSLDEDDKP